MSTLKATLQRKIEEHRPRTTRLLKEYGDVKISDVTVYRYLKPLRDGNRDEVLAILQEHNKTHLPKDLDILEDMEALTEKRYSPGAALRGVVHPERISILEARE